MERFCTKCGSLVSGDGAFCTNCGAPMESVVNLDKPEASASQMPTVNTTATPVNNTVNATTGVGSNHGTMPDYGTPIYPTAPAAKPEMTTGQWVLTIFLSSLGIIGLILLFVWGFSNDTPTSKKNYARAMLIWYAISLGLVVLYLIALFSCVGCAGIGIADIFDDINYMAFMR